MIPGVLSLVRLLRLACSASSPMSIDSRSGATGDSPAYSSSGLKYLSQTTSSGAYGTSSRPRPT